MINANASVKRIVRAQKITVGMLVYVFVINGEYLISIADTIVNVCNEIINSTDNVSANVKNNIPTNMTSSISTIVPF